MKNKKIKEKNYIEFEKFEEALEWGRNNYLNIFNEESNEFKCLSYYTGSAYNLYNRLLRSIKYQNLDKYKKEYGETIEEIKTIQEELNKHKCPNNIVVYRYTKLKDFLYFVNGYPFKNKEFTINQFVSTTLFKNAIQEFRKQNLYCLLLKIYISKGTPGVFFDDSLVTNSCLEEAEFILPTELKYHIIKKRLFPFIIELEVVL